MTEITPGPGWWKAADGQWYPPRWEYRWVPGWLNPKKGHESIEEELAELGQAGWEAVTFTGAKDHNQYTPARVVVLLKRPITS